jgi:hypothetical protein
MVLGALLSPGRRVRRKIFFSEEKKQKTFMSLSRFYPPAYAKT